jgi:hypothetical protein
VAVKAKKATKKIITPHNNTIAAFVIAGLGATATNRAKVKSNTIATNMPPSIMTLAFPYPRTDVIMEPATATPAAIHGRNRMSCCLQDFPRSTHDVREHGKHRSKKRDSDYDYNPICGHNLLLRLHYILFALIIFGKDFDADRTLTPT